MRPFLSDHGGPTASAAPTNGRLGGKEPRGKRAGRYTSEDVHEVLFEEAPEPKTLEELKEGVRRYMKSRHAGH
jgi:hypothetical protein